MDGSEGKGDGLTPFPFPFVPLDLALACNTPDHEILANVRVNAARRLPWLEEAAAHEGVAVLVGGGPSLADTLEAIQILANSGHSIFALNGAEKWLREQGIKVDYHVVIDPRRSNKKFLEGSTAKTFCLASQCAPELFDALQGKNVMLFHMAGDGVEAQFEEDNVIQVCGGITIGLSAMSLAYAMGFREIHLFGYDSSDRDGEGHAYEQAENHIEQKRVEVWVAGQLFRAQAALIGQAHAFPKWASLMMRHGVHLHVHGSGLLPTIAKEMQKPQPEDAACYDMSVAPASWDFSAWLILAEMQKRAVGVTTPLRVAFMAGPDQGFRNDWLPGRIDQKQMLLDNVMRPLLRLVGAVEDQSAYNGFPSFCYVMKPVVDAARKGHEVPKYVPLQDDLEIVDRWMHGGPPITITLREADYWPMRNSNLEAWLEFARRRTEEDENVIFVRDTAKADDLSLPYRMWPQASVDVGIRAALYHRAKVNLFVCNGPMALAVFGERPFLIFNEIVPDSCASEWAWNNQHGMEIGEQYPWAGPFQRLTWSRDTIENIETAWQKLMADINGVSLAAE